MKTTEVSTIRRGLTRSEIAVQGLVATAAERYGLDPSLLMAHIFAESAFNPRATYRDVDGVMSYGLGQIRMDTAVGLADQPVSPALLLEPSFNIRIMGAIVRANLDRYQGDVQSAIAAYNAGVARRDRFGRFVNSRGDPKVQGYVTKVVTATMLYRQGVSPMRHQWARVATTMGLPIGLAVGIGALWMLWRQLTRRPRYAA